MPRRMFRLQAIGAVALAFTVAAISAPATQAEESVAGPSASDVAEFAEIADTYLQKRADAVTAVGTKRRVLSAPTDVTRSLTEELEDDFTSLADQGRGRPLWSRPDHTAHRAHQ